jgi:hypothetical protein
MDLADLSQDWWFSASWNSFRVSHAFRVLRDRVGSLTSESTLELSLIFLSEQLSQAVETTFPERTTISDPSLSHTETFRFHATGSDPPNFFGTHQTAFFEDLQVLDDGGESDVERLRQLGDGNRAFAQFLNDGSPGWIAQGMENAVYVDSLGKHAILFSSMFPVQAARSTESYWASSFARCSSS